MAFGKVDNTDNSGLPPLRILVVDDDDLNRRMMQILLMRVGHHVELVTNGLEALDAVKYHKFDIVFMDLQMPTMDGVEASRRIREWENGAAHTFIVALTASYLPEEGHMLFEAGIDNYIAKPFDVDHVNRMLDYISRRVQAAAAQAHPALNDTQAASSMLNVQQGIKRVGGDLDAYKELLGDFVEELPCRVATLEQHIREKNWGALSLGAHNLKGIASSLGALELAECAGKLDKHDKEGYTELDHSLILELKRVETILRNTAADFLVTKEMTAKQA
jgi:CheY-like chemotaxis protein